MALAMRVHTSAVRNGLVKSASPSRSGKDPLSHWLAMVTICPVTSMNSSYDEPLFQTRGTLAGSIPCLIQEFCTRLAPPADPSEGRRDREVPTPRQRRDVAVSPLNSIEVGNFEVRNDNRDRAERGEEFSRCRPWVLASTGHRQARTVWSDTACTAPAGSPGRGCRRVQAGERGGPHVLAYSVRPRGSPHTKDVVRCRRRGSRANARRSDG